MATNFEHSVSYPFGTERLWELISSEQYWAAVIEATNASHGSVDSVTVDGSQVTVASQVELTLDLRHEDLAQLDALSARVLGEIEAQCRALGVGFASENTADSPPVPFDPAVIAAIEAARIKNGYPGRRMVSGAGHDACNMARVLPAGMIFVPSANGISHNEAEYTSPEDCAAGAQVLLDSVLTLAG